MADGTLTPSVQSSLLADAKLALRISSTAYDSEVEALIASCKTDLKLSGVSVAAVDAVTPDPLIRSAVIVYCKGTFGLDNPDSEKFMVSYASIKTSLALAAEYQQPVLKGITGAITLGTSDLTVSDATSLTLGAWVSVAGAGADGALLVARVDDIADTLVTLNTVAGTTVASAAVVVLP